MAALLRWIEKFWRILKSKCDLKKEAFFTRGPTSGSWQVEEFLKHP